MTTVTIAYTPDYNVKGIRITYANGLSTIIPTYHYACACDLREVLQTTVPSHGVPVGITRELKDITAVGIAYTDDHRVHGVRIVFNHNLTHIIPTYHYGSACA